MKKVDLEDIEKFIEFVYTRTNSLYAHDIGHSMIEFHAEFDSCEDAINVSAAALMRDEMDGRLGTISDEEKCDPFLMLRVHRDFGLKLCELWGLELNEDYRIED